MYRSVRKIERNMLNYGAGALRLRARVVDDPNAIRERGNQTCPSILIKTLKTKLLCICPRACQNDDTSRSNNARSHRKRAVLYMAMSYSLTWALVWIPFYIMLFVFRFYHFSSVLTGILSPLQGLYNLIVYMSPKVRHARNTRRGKLPWCQAIAKAWMSKGEQDRAILVGRRQSIIFSMRERFQGRLSLLIPR